MKKTILLLAFVGASGISGAAQAQSAIGKGTGLLTGSVGYQLNTNEYTNAAPGSPTSTTTIKAGTFRLDFAVGGFVADNLALGLQLQHTVTGGSYKSSNNNNSTAGPASTSTLRVGPMVQYYKMLTDQFGLTATLGAGYESDNVAHQYVQYFNGYPNYYYANMKATGYYGAITPGIIFLPVPKFGLTASIGSLSYNRLKLKDSDEIASTWDAGFGFSQLQFGANYYFGRK